MPRHEDYCTLLKNPEDQDILTRRLFDVNTRLFASSEEYRTIVIQCCDYIQWCAQTPKAGYKKPHGYSGANAGIPFNIIALANGTVMINPKIVNHVGVKEGMSNCGSLLLEKPIKIMRYAEVEVSYLNIEVGLPETLISKTMKGYLPTVQHEIDHNNGILITDRRV